MRSSLASCLRWVFVHSPVMLFQRGCTFNLRGHKAVCSRLQKKKKHECPKGTTSVFPSSSSAPNATQFNAARLSYACRPLQTNGQPSSNTVAFAAQPESLLTIFLVSNNVICSLHIVTEQRTQRSRAGRWTPLTSPPAGGSAN